MHILENSSPIDLALMVVISEAFLQGLEDKATQEALTTNLAPLTYEKYADDSHARLETIFLNILSKQNQAVNTQWIKKTNHKN